MSYKRGRKRFDVESVGTGVFFGIWVLGALATIAFWVFVVWAIVQVLQHFSVI